MSKEAVIGIFVGIGGVGVNIVWPNYKPLGWFLIALGFGGALVFWFIHKSEPKSQYEGFSLFIDRKIKQLRKIGKWFCNDSKENLRNIRETRAEIANGFLKCMGKVAEDGYNSKTAWFKDYEDLTKVEFKYIVDSMCKHLNDIRKETTSESFLKGFKSNDLDGI